MAYNTQFIYDSKTCILTAETLSPPLEHYALVGAHAGVLHGGPTAHGEALLAGKVTAQTRAHVNHTELSVRLGALVTVTLVEHEGCVTEERAETSHLLDLKYKVVYKLM